MLSMWQLKGRVLSRDMGPRWHRAWRMHSHRLSGLLCQDYRHLRGHSGHQTLLLLAPLGQLVQRSLLSPGPPNLLLVFVHVQLGRMQWSHLDHQALLSTHIRFALFDFAPLFQTHNLTILTCNQLELCLFESLRKFQTRFFIFQSLLILVNRLSLLNFFCRNYFVLANDACFDIVFLGKFYI